MDGFNLGDLISLIIVFALYLIAASGKGKKGKKGAGGQASRSFMRTRMQGQQADKRADAPDRQTHAGFDDAFGSKMHVEKKTAHPSCDTGRIHLHEVSPQQLVEASEGEDPCHAGGVDLPDSSPFDLEQEAENCVLAQDVLHGVIMSEILTRPHERAAMRRGRR